MKNEKNNEIDVAKWLSGELTPEEASAFEQSDDYKAYAKIINATEKLKDPAYDEDAVFAKIKEKITPRPSVKKLNLQRYAYMAAASLLLFFVLYTFLNTTSESFDTGFGEQLVVMLPDGSEVTLNSKSTLSYDKDTWSNDRTIHLEGEAYFKVIKGSPFKVITTEGTVEVLGTIFNVDSNTDFFEVHCYTGKVKVTNTKSISHILTSGKAVRTYHDLVTDWTFDSAEKNWISGLSSFTNTPFLEVIDALEDQYQLNIKNTAPFAQERFTGRFTNNDRNVALQTVFEAMDIAYKLENNTVTLSKK